MENFKAIIPQAFKGWEGVLEGVKIIGFFLLALLIFFIAIRGLNFILGFLFKGLSERAVGMMTVIIGILFLMWFFEM